MSPFHLILGLIIGAFISAAIITALLRYSFTFKASYWNVFGALIAGLLLAIPVGFVIGAIGLARPVIIPMAVGFAIQVVLLGLIVKDDEGRKLGMLSGLGVSVIAGVVGILLRIVFSWIGVPFQLPF